MDLIDLTLRRYQRLAPPAHLAPTLETSEALEAWLAGNVSFLVEELMERETFRELANWPLTAFDYDIDTPQRSLLRAVDSALVKFAQALLRLARQPSVTQLLIELEAKWPCPVEPWLTGKQIADDATPGMAAIETVSRRPWLDLAAPEEYFHPSRQLCTLESEPSLEEFDPLTSSQMPLLGDYITRSIFLRIKYWREQLSRLYNQCTVALSLHGDADLLRECLHARTSLEDSERAFTLECLSTTDFRSRENAIALVQVYNAYASVPKLEWLEVPTDIVEAMRGLTRLRVRRSDICDMNAIELIVNAIMGSAAIYRAADKGESQLAKALVAKRLVLTDSPRTAYWNSQRIEKNWERKTMLWELLWELADQARFGLAVDRDRLSNKSSVRAIRDRRSDLGKLLPPELNDLIVAAGRYSYRLDLPPDSVALLVHEDDELHEESGSPLDRELLAAAQRPSRGPTIQE
jgi:hypothetical protein